MLRNIALTATGLAFCLLMFVYLLNAPEQAARSMEIAAVAPASVVAPAEVATAPPAPTATAVVVEAVATVAQSPLPSPSVEERIVRLLEENNRGIATTVSISRMMDTITVRWALNDRDTDTMLVEADRRMVEAVGVLGDQYRLINFEGTFALVYPDGRKAEEVVLWATYEDGRQVSRKVAPVLGME